MSPDQETVELNRARWSRRGSPLDLRWLCRLYVLLLQYLSCFVATVVATGFVAQATSFAMEGDWARFGLTMLGAPISLSTLVYFRKIPIDGTLKADHQKLLLHLALTSFLVGTYLCSSFDTIQRFHYFDQLYKIMYSFVFVRCLLGFLEMFCICMLLMDLLTDVNQAGPASQKSFAQPGGL